MRRFIHNNGMDERWKYFNKRTETLDFIYEYAEKVLSFMG